MRELLLEIGVEEVPARFLTATAANLKKAAMEQLGAFNIGFTEVKSYVTPRRLSVIAEGLPEVQADVIKEVFGPPKKIAFDANGAPTKAAIGFAKSVGISPEKLVIKEKNSGQYVAAIIEEKGRPVREVLPEALKKIVLSLGFPKSMRWGYGSFRFVRPVRWMLALFDFEIVSFELEDIRSSNATRGHRFLSPGTFQVREAHAYKKLLETSFVIVDQDKRRRIIESDLEKLSASVDGVYLGDEDLLETVTNLVEYPVGVLCEFSKEYLELPEELLITVMKDHQKYFAIKDSSGRLLNHYVVIGNTLKENSFVVRAGAERVIRARFEDARFYYRDDMKRTLASRVEDLKKVTFFEGLGTLYDKSARLKELASGIAGSLFPEKKAFAERAGVLAKADLITGVVREFPELQGVMAKYYAAHDGEPEEVSEALLEQYLPRHMGDVLPATDTGAALALADRLDNIGAFFSLGLTPTGSEDPYALRRQAIGIYSILLNGGYPVTVKYLLEKALEALGHKADLKLESEILAFLESRLPQIFEARGFEPDAIESVLPYSAHIPMKGLTERLQALARFKRNEMFASFLAAIKRIRNIVPPRELPAPPIIDEMLFREEKEKELHGSFRAVEGKVRSLLSEERFDDALSALAAITAPVNAFFDAVLVMDKDERVRDNRLALLASIWALALGIADFSKLSEA